MEIPVINRISEFDTVILHSLQNTSRHFPIFHRNFCFWQFGALVLLAFVAFFNRIKIFIFRFHKHLFPISYQQLIQKFDDEILFSDDDDDDVSSSCTSDYGEEEEFDGGLSDCDDFRVAGVLRRFDEGEGQNGKFNLRRRRSFAGDGFSLSEFTSGKSVVKLWDGFGLGLDLKSFNGSVISLYDLGKDKKLSSFPGELCQFTTFTGTPPAVIFSAGIESSRNLALKVWDARVGCQIPAIISNWCNVGGNVASIKSNGGNKVYVRDDGGSGELGVRDIRKVNVALDNVKEYDEDTWWDADAVIVSHQCENDNTAAYNLDESFCQDGVWPNLF